MTTIFARVMFLAGWLFSSTVLGNSNPVLVTGKGFKVEESELETSMQSDARKPRIRGGDLTLVKQAILDAVIEKKLLQLEAQRLGVMERIQAKVESEMAAFKKRYETDAARKSFYVNSGVTEEILRDRYEEAAILRRIEKEMSIRKPDAVATKADSSSLPLKNDGVVIRELFLAKGDENAKPSNEERKALAAEISAKWATDKEYVRKQLGRPEFKGLIRFGGYARSTVPGTEFEAMPGSQGALSSELRVVAEKLKPGEISEVIATEAGFHVLSAAMTNNSADDRKAKAAAEQKAKWDAYISELKKRYEVKIIAQPE